MAGLGSLSPARHFGVASVVAASAAAGLLGIVGEDLPERFDAKQIVVAPAGGDALRIRETVDQDFGSARDRHGYQRVIPHDFGVPTDIVASSPDAPADVNVLDSYEETRVRVGDPNETVRDQHRYVLEYTYPEARLGTGRLGLDVIGDRTDNETRRLEIVVTGLRLENVECNTGREDDVGGCELIEEDGVYRAVIAPLDEGDGVTIGADVLGVTDAREIPAPPLPERRDNGARGVLGLAMAGLGTATSGGIYAWARRRGRNEVAGTGAADAAFGTDPGDLTRRAGQPLPPPSLAAPSGPASSGPTRLVADDDMAALATTEFVPPPGVAPWQAALVLRERIDDASVGAWFSSMAARNALLIDKDVAGKVVLRPGAEMASVDPGDRALLDALFVVGDQVTLRKYSASFAQVWRNARTMEQSWLTTSGWWTRPPTNGGSGVGAIVPTLIIAFVVLGVLSGIGVGRLLGVFSSPIAALIAGAGACAIAAFAAYRTMLPARSVTGSAVALRAESFRRFLEASEGRHVEWAWKQGLVREYSAWAVALGAADAWQRALESSNVDPVEYRGGPMLLYTMGPSFGQAHTPPSSSGGGSGGGGGGGFSGGSVGGGGGGGSSGSW